MSFSRLVCVVIALTALLALSAGSVSTAAAAPATDAAAAAKKKCKGKKKAAKKGKKCKKKQKRQQAQPPAASGPEIPAGDYVCSYVTSYGTNYAGTVHILSGNRYTVNEGSAGTYRYFPDTGIMQFPSGDYQTFFGRYVPDSKGFDVYSNVNDGALQVGDYGWTCSTS
jgi:hypothetical protein